MWEIWLIIAIIFALVEIYYNTFFLLWFLIGALVTLMTSLFLHNLLVESTIFLIISLTLLLMFTKYFTRKFSNKKTLVMNTDKLIGSHGIVIKGIGQNLLESGLVKLDGEVWSAISSSSNSITEDSIVEVTAIKGVHLIVSNTTSCRDKQNNPSNDSESF